MRLPAALRNPLHLATLMVWLGIGFDLVDGSPRARLGLDAATVQLLSLGLHGLFLVTALWPVAGDARGPGRFVPASAAATLAFGLVALRPYTASAVLLIVVMARFAHLLTVAHGVALWALVNVALYLLLRELSTLPQPATYTLLMASFQLFAMVTSWATLNAERARDALARSNAELSATRSLLAASARDQERLRLARELHDVAGHKLTALKLNLAAAARRPEAPATPEVALAARLADELLGDIRAVVAEMRAPDGIDLGRAIADLAAPLPHPKVHVAIALEATVRTVEQAEAIVRAVQEALTNAVRHSGAGNVWVVLRREGDRLELDIRDDGRGSGPIAFGSGLCGMRERLRQLGGDLAVSRGAGGGVALHAWFSLA
jgi:signal transduction histidine kinase